MSSPSDSYPNQERMYPAPGFESERLSVEEVLLANALGDLSQANWAAAERGFASALTHSALRAGYGALSIVGVAQARLLGRMDARGAFAMLQSILQKPAELGAHVATRLHVVAALLFGTPEVGLFDPDLSRAHVRAARAALAREPDPELSALAAIAELFAALDGDASAFVALAQARAAELTTETSAVTRCLLLEVRALARLAASDGAGEARLLEEALAAAHSLGFDALAARVLARQARQSLLAGDRTQALDELALAAAALVRAGAEGSWLQLALAETRRAVHSPASVEIAGFRFAALGLWALPVKRAPSQAPALMQLVPKLDIDAQIARLAPSRASVLLIADSKELAFATARALHERSPCAAGPFVALDCAAIESAALELSLFGGPAYALGGRGAVHEAETGTLYVATIDELPLLLQPRFLRFLDEAARVRVVTSTDLDLAERMQHGAFRRDLGERLLLVQLHLPRGASSG